MRKADRLLLVAVAASVLAACATAPAYVPPAVSVRPPSRRPVPGPRPPPADAQARGEWWRVYRDPVLDDLEARAARANPGLAAAVAAHDQAVALAAQARGGLFPSIDGSALASRQRRSDNAPCATAASTSTRPARSSRRRRTRSTCGAACATRSPPEPPRPRPAPPTWVRAPQRCRPNWPTAIWPCAASTPRPSCWSTPSRPISGRWT